MPQKDSKKPVVMIVDDDRTLCHLIQSWLDKEDYHVETYNDGESCLAALAHTLPDAVVLDLHMPGLQGLDVLEVIRKRNPNLPVLILTSDAQVTTVVEAMKKGAFDYLTKPIQRPDLHHRLQRAVESYRMALKLTHLEREVEGKGYPGIVGRCDAMKGVYRQMDRLRTSDITVIVHGESGTGKELIAQAIHQHSSRCGEPFVPVNCAAIPDTLQESELFGHEKGSFTGATTRRIGRFEQAHRGTLFLDEIAELSLPAQAKLLRVLQERKFLRVGGAKEITSDFRLIAATHRNLSQRVSQGRFREDLFFRVAVFELEVPPLRERGSDVIELAERIASDFASREDRDAPQLSPAAKTAIELYTWPGNVRELQNAIQRAIVVAEEGVIDIAHLPPRIVQALPLPAGGDATCATTSEEGIETAAANGHDENGHADKVAAFATNGKPATLEDLERQAIAAALVRAGGNLSRVCRELGIGRTTLYRKIKKYELR